MKIGKILRKLPTTEIATGLLLSAMLTACSETEEDPVVDETSETEDSQVVAKQQSDNEAVEKEKPQTNSSEPPSFDTYEEYIEYISTINAFEPYYKTVFAFEKIAGGMSNVPIDQVKAMYDEMKTAFDYVLVREYALNYIGFYDGDTKFVDGYEQSQGRNVNMTATNYKGNEYFITPLKAISIGESLFSRFNSSIAEGRNLQQSDYTLASADKPIRVVLGSAYKDLYKIGDTFSFEFISEIMNFEVVGFYKPDVSFSMDVAALQPMNFDYTIVMPHFIPEYKPVGEAAVFQHAFHLAELTSGFIKINESIEKINEDTYDHTVKRMEEMAAKHGLSELYMIPSWPVGFVW